jgi:hypothetical protein
MKASNSFKEIIQSHLQGVADKDPLFAETFKKPNKNIDDCITYILNEVKKSGCAGFADDEVYGMAIHYYDEDDIKPGAKVSAQVVVNHSAPATAKQEPKAAPVQAPAAKPSKKKEKPVSPVFQESFF